MPGPEGPIVGPATRGQCGHSHCQTLDKAKRDLDREEGILPSFTSPAPGLLLVNSSWESHFQIWKQKNSTILRRSLAKKKKNPGKVVKMSIILIGNKTQLQPIQCSCQDIVKVLTLKMFDWSRSYKQGCTFLAGNEMVKRVQGQGAEPSKWNSKELDSRVVWAAPFSFDFFDLVEGQARS